MNRRRPCETNPHEAPIARDKCSLDIFWLKDESLEAGENLPAPEVIARDIVEDIRAALEQFEPVALDLGGDSGD